MLVLLAHLCHALDMKKFLRFIYAFLIYAIVDIGWNITPLAVNMYAALHKASGNDWSFGKVFSTWGIAELLGIVVFFLLIAFANSYLAIEPAIKANKLKIAVLNSMALGAAAYATYIVPVFIAIANWPGILIPIDIAIGAILSLITSTIVTSLALRKRNKGRN